MFHLFHYEVGIPQEVRRLLPSGTFQLRYTKHAQVQAHERGCVASLPRELTTGRAWMIECGLCPEGLLWHVLYRVSLDDEHDVCLAVDPCAGRHFVVKTVFVNPKRDTHATLNKCRYTTPEMFRTLLQGK